jgi:hypothetical protein
MYSTTNLDFHCLQARPYIWKWLSCACHPEYSRTPKKKKKIGKILISMLNASFSLYKIRLCYHLYFGPHFIPNLVIIVLDISPFMQVAWNPISHNHTNIIHELVNLITVWRAICREVDLSIFYPDIVFPLICGLWSFSFRFRSRHIYQFTKKVKHALYHNKIKNIRK